MGEFAERVGVRRETEKSIKYQVCFCVYLQKKGKF